MVLGLAGCCFGAVLGLARLRRPTMSQRRTQEPVRSLGNEGAAGGGRSALLVVAVVAGGAGWIICGLVAGMVLVLGVLAARRMASGLVVARRRSDIAMAVRIADNAKTQKYSPCNATEGLLVARGVADAFLPKIAAVYAEKGVEMRCDEAAAHILRALPAIDSIANIVLASEQRRFTNCFIVRYVTFWPTGALTLNSFERHRTPPRKILFYVSSAGPRTIWWWLVQKSSAAPNVGIKGPYCSTAVCCWLRHDSRRNCLVWRS